MDCDGIANQFSQMSMASNRREPVHDEVHLERFEQNAMDERGEQNFSDARLNDVKERLKARQVLRAQQTTSTTAKLIPLDEAVRLYNEDKKLAEVRFMAAFGQIRAHPSDSHPHNSSTVAISNDSRMSPERLRRYQCERERTFLSITRVSSVSSQADFAVTHKHRNAVTLSGVSLRPFCFNDRRVQLLLQGDCTSRSIAMKKGGCLSKC